MAIREGKWDCRVCDRKGNRGPDSYCGSCGSPRPDDVEFYLPDDAEEVTDGRRLMEAEAGADWKCSYCSTQNNAFDDFCVSCGNKKDAAQGDVSMKEKEIRFDSINPPAPEAVATEQKRGTVGRKILILLAAISGAVIIFIGLSMITSDIPVKVTGFEYTAKISYEEYKLVTEDDWTLPAGAEKLGEYRAIHHYNKVPDGYETKTRQVQVKVGEKQVKVGVKDLGNGYFKDIYENEPVYETKTETYRETRYRDVPVFMNKYKYRMQKWVQERPVELSGKDKNLAFLRREEEFKKSPDRFRNIRTDAKFFLTVIDESGETHTDDVKFETWSGSELNKSLTAEKSSLFGIFYGIKE